MDKNRNGFLKEIVGYDDIKRDLYIISDMLNNPEEYAKMGASKLDGVILYGEPGTGKTTMASGLINSTKRKCFVCRKKFADGSFISKIVQVFEDAKKNAPSIILLDDVDKFSDKIDDDAPEAEEFATLQACIDEIRGEDIFILATANKKGRLPDSLLRPGRLGKAIKIRNPRKDETAEIIRFYLDKANTSDDLDEESIAMMLQGESCAILEEVIRSSAVKAAFKRQEFITMENIVDACLDIVFEAGEFDKSYDEKTLKMTAYHEAGHALVSELLDPCSVSIASIRPGYGRTLGLVRYCRKESEEFTFEDHENILKAVLAGKAATDIIYGEPDVGAHDDLKRAFRLTEKIVDQYCSYGFHNWIYDGYSDSSGENRNHTMATIMETNYVAAKMILAKNRDKLDRLADALMEKTTLIHTDIQKIVNS